MRTHESLLGAMVVVSIGLGACSGEIGELTRQGAEGSASSASSPGGPGGGPLGGSGAPGTSGSGSGNSAGNGSGNGAGSGSGNAAGSPPIGPKSDPTCAQVHPGPTPLRRLTREEYGYTVLDLLGDTTTPAGGFPPDGAANGFHNSATLSTASQLSVDKYQEAAEGIAQRAIDNKLSTVLAGCDTGKDGEDTCVTSFVTKFGRRMFRRPVSTDEEQAIRSVVEWGRKNRDFKRAISLGLQVMLQHPAFLYRLELATPGAPGSVVKLSPFEVATRLSYLIWSSAPDDKLLAKAEAGGLTTADDVRATAVEMMKDAKAKRTLHSFHEQWLEIEEVPYAERSAKMFPQFTSDLAKAMKEETDRFIDAIFFESDRKLSTLVSAKWTYANEGLAKLYGVTAPAGGGFAKVDLTATKQRAGILTHASVMTSHAKFDRSAPVLRGRFVRQRLLCVPIPDPDMNIMGLFPNIDPTNLTTREYFEEHVKNPACSGCHDKMDPIGFGFEHYDGIGAWRDQEKGKPINSKGSLEGAGSVDGDYDGALEMTAKLANSEELANCMVHQWFRFSAGRAETDEDKCSLHRVKTTFQQSGRDLSELMTALTATDAFLFRTVGGDQ